MLSFFKRKKKTGTDSTVSSEELLNQVNEVSEEIEVQTELSIHPSMNVTQEDQYVLRFMSNDLPPLKPNQISIAGIELQQFDEGVVVVAFVRNSLPQSIHFEPTTLVLLGQNGEKLARNTFDLSELGELPAKSSRPWNFAFERTTFLADELPQEGWSLAFELKPKHTLDLAPAWEENMPEEEKEKLKAYVENMETLQPGEVKLSGLQAELSPEGDLHVTMLIRNGTDQNLKIEKLPLQIMDASGEIIAKGGFSLVDFGVKAHSSKPWTFIFPNSLVLSDTLDLSSWKALPIYEEEK
jgi:accessory Sec system S-layer assembly protein